MARRATRELAFRIVYQTDFGTEPDCNQEIEYFPKQVDAEYLSTLVDGVNAVKPALDELIARYSRGWSSERLPRVDKAILRIGIFELLRDTVPEAVAINEAVELAKAYGNDKSAGYINGLLETVRKNKETLAQELEP